MKSPLLVWWMTLVTLISKCYIEIILVWSSAQEYQEFLCDTSSGWCSLGPNTLKVGYILLHITWSSLLSSLSYAKIQGLQHSIPHSVVQNTCEEMFACLLSVGCNWGQRAVRSRKMLHCISLSLAWVLIPFQYTSRFSWTWTTISWLLHPSPFLLVFCLLVLLYIHLWNVSG